MEHESFDPVERLCYTGSRGMGALESVPATGPTGDETGSLHMQTLGGIAHFDFNVPGAYGYEHAAEIMRRLRLSNANITRFFRRMMFNVAARNQDDHVKNISFLMDRHGVWTLSPAYDITYAYNPDGMWMGSHQMTSMARGMESAGAISWMQQRIWVFAGRLLPR